MTKRYDEPIEVAMADHRPVSFSWRGRHYVVQRLLNHWRESTCTWDPERAADHDCFRVEADGGTYELRLDRRAPLERPAWHLARVWD
ncbi:MAG TPA: DUF6504 family protein [Actinomycetota bacterium]|jgi:hypothetical protein